MRQVTGTESLLHVIGEISAETRKKLISAVYGLYWELERKFFYSAQICKD